MLFDVCSRLRPSGTSFPYPAFFRGVLGAERYIEGQEEYQEGEGEKKVGSEWYKGTEPEVRAQIEESTEDASSSVDS
jgi:hypothetical protein